VTENRAILMGRECRQRKVILCYWEAYCSEVFDAAVDVVVYFVDNSNLQRSAVETDTHLPSNSIAGGSRGGVGSVR
jgi:hypothetical protein